MKKETQIAIVDAVDWSVIESQVPIAMGFGPVQGFIVGMVIELTDSHISLAHTYFPDSDTVRHTTSIPMDMVNSITYLIPEENRSEQ